MRKYRLIKEYPGSPKLNTILTPKELQYCNWDEYYEEIVEKDYEILNFISTENNIAQLSYFTCENNFTGNNIWKIYSIKRKSDGEIFTIGDKTNGGSIKEICLMGLVVSNIKQPDFIHIVYNHDLKDSIYPDFNNVQKLKQPLFTTEDGVDIFEGDIYYKVINDTFQLFIMENASKGESLRSKVFSTKEKAEEYILMNKPCLSLNDIFKDVEKMRKGLKTFENSELAKRFKKLVQQKLNK